MSSSCILITTVPALEGGSSAPNLTSRRVWSKRKDSGNIKKAKPAAIKTEDRLSSAARHSRLAKYTTHHLPDPNSRCASGMVSQSLVRIIYQIS